MAAVRFRSIRTGRFVASTSRAKKKRVQTWRWKKPVTVEEPEELELEPEEEEEPEEKLAELEGKLAEAIAEEKTLPVSERENLRDLYLSDEIDAAVKRLSVPYKTEPGRRAADYVTIRFRVRRDEPREVLDESERRIRKETGEIRRLKKRDDVFVTQKLVRVHTEEEKRGIVDSLVATFLRDFASRGYLESMAPISATFWSRQPSPRVKKSSVYARTKGRA